MPNNNNTFVPGRHVTNGSISGIVLTQRGYLVRVLNTNTNTPFWFDAVDLRGTRGRPGIVHPSGLCQFDVNAFIASSHQFCQEGIRLLFGRQNDMEQARGTTIERNEVGFRADHARRGSILAQLAPMLGVTQSMSPLVVFSIGIAAPSFLIWLLTISKSNRHSACFERGGEIPPFFYPFNIRY